MPDAKKREDGLDLDKGKETESVKDEAKEAEAFKDEAKEAEAFKDKAKETESTEDEAETAKDKEKETEIAEDKAKVVRGKETGSDEEKISEPRRKTAEKERKRRSSASQAGKRKASSGKGRGKASKGIDPARLVNEGVSGGTEEENNKLIDKLTIEMTKAAKDLDFERAAEIRDIDRKSTRLNSSHSV